MKIADIQLYVNDLGDDEIVYTAVMNVFVGTGDSPQAALSNLHKVMATHTIKHLHMMTSEEMSLAHHFLCEDDMTLSDFVTIAHHFLCEDELGS
jgi:hypothetical protein